MTLLTLAQPLSALTPQQARDMKAVLDAEVAQGTERVDVAEDAFVLTLCVKAIVNLSTVPQGCVAIVDSGVVTGLRRLWQWLTPRLQASLAADLLHNVTKSRGYSVKVAEEGAVLVLAQVVNSLVDSTNPEDIQIVRRCAVSLCRLTRSLPSSERMIEEQGVRALTRVVQSLAQGGEHSSDTPSRRIGSRVIRVTTLRRLASAAVSRLLWRPEMCLAAAAQGACLAVSLLMASQDRYVWWSFRSL